MDKTTKILILEKSLDMACNRLACLNKQTFLSYEAQQKEKEKLKNYFNKTAKMSVECGV